MISVHTRCQSSVVVAGSGGKATVEVVVAVAEVVAGTVVVETRVEIVVDARSVATEVVVASSPAAELQPANTKAINSTTVASALSNVDPPSPAKG